MMDKEIANIRKVILTTSIPNDIVDDAKESSSVSSTIFHFHEKAKTAWEYHVNNEACGGKNLQRIIVNSSKKDVDFFYFITIEGSIWLILVDVKYSAQNSRPSFNKGHTFSNEGLSRLYQCVQQHPTDQVTFSSFLNFCDHDVEKFISKAIIVSAVLDSTNRFTVYLFHWIQMRVNMDYLFISDILRDKNVEEAGDCEEETRYVMIPVSILKNHH